MVHVKPTLIYMCYISRSTKIGGVNMITLSEVLKRAEAQTVLPAKTKKRLLKNILKQLLNLKPK